MRRLIPIFVLPLLAGLWGCNFGANETTQSQQQFDCNSLDDKNVVLNIANSIIDKHDNDAIWNLLEIDSTDFFSIEDYFTNPETKTRLTLIGGSAGLSSGTADNLLLLFSCSDSLHVIWSGQVGDISKTDISDLNGDGIMEIVIHASSMWMGECRESCHIINFKNGKHNSLYSGRSFSLLDCGFDNLAKTCAPGDTLENKMNWTIEKLNEREYLVNQVRTIKIHQGGKTEDEMLRNLKIHVDTSQVRL